MKLRRIYLTLMGKYFTFILIQSFIMVIAITYFAIIMTDTMMNLPPPVFTAREVLKKVPNGDLNQINLTKIEKLNGWVEILNEKKEVIGVKGQKKDRISTYSEKELFEALENHEKNPYYYSVAPFLNQRGENNNLLVKIPRSEIRIQIDEANLRNDDPVIARVGKALLTSLAILFGLFLASLLLFSYWSAKKISTPLSIITEGLEKMTKGLYGTRIILKGEREFVQISEAFNYLAERLETAEEEKRKIEESKKRMILDISHDLRTPVTTIQGYATALNEGMVEDEEKKKRYLKVIYTKAQRITLLIDSLFDLTLLDSSGHKIIKGQYDFAEFIREIVVEYYEEIEDKGMVLDLHLPAQEVLFSFDKKEMARAVGNVLANALKHNPPGIRIRIELKETSEGILLEIGDNGAGINKELQDNLFEPFVTGDEARQSTGGTGLGLAIARKVIEKHGGTLQLYNREEEKVFSIFLKR